MKIIRQSNENEMILEFLKGELSSLRFYKKLNNVITKLDLEENLITNGIATDEIENKKRKKIMEVYRGYPNKELFLNFPNIYKWNIVEFEKGDLDSIYYINYDYWNELSNGTSNPKEASKNIKQGIEIYGVSNMPFIKGLKYLESNKFPPLILITCNDKKFLIIEGHSRMTVYGMEPENFNGTYGFIGYALEQDMKKYDSRMLI